MNNPDRPFQTLVYQRSNDEDILALARQDIRLNLDAIFDVTMDHKAIMKMVKCEFVQLALDRCKGNSSEVARAFNISRSSVQKYAKGMEL